MKLTFALASIYAVASILEPVAAKAFAGFSAIAAAL